MSERRISGCQKNVVCHVEISMSPILRFFEVTALTEYNRIVLLSPKGHCITIQCIFTREIPQNYQTCASSFPRNVSHLMWNFDPKNPQPNFLALIGLLWAFSLWFQGWCYTFSFDLKRKKTVWMNCKKKIRLASLKLTASLAPENGCLENKYIVSFWDNLFFQGANLLLVWADGIVFFITKYTLPFCAF